MQTDPLILAAERLGVPVDASAGPPEEAGIKIWARWPRDRLEIAHDTLERVMQIEHGTDIALDGETGIWRARCGTWTFTGPFEEAVAMVALHVTADERHEVPLEDHTGWASATH
jgi:uncharacterized cupin superfamily protein